MVRQLPSEQQNNGDEVARVSDGRPARVSLVIGASGFLSSHVTRRLADAGETVHVMTRASSDTSAIDDLVVVKHVGDIHDPDALRTAMAAATDVYYCVVDARPWLRDPTPMQRANVDALRVVLPVAAAAGLRRFVFTSSVVTLTCGPHPGESDRAWRRRVGAYVATRVEAENLVTTYSRDHGLPAVSMCVANTYGSGDLAPTPHGGLVMLAAFGRLGLYPRGVAADVVGIDDAADALVLAAEHGRDGSRYAVTEAVMGTGEIAAIAADEAGVEPPRRAVPLAAMVAAGAVSEIVSRMTGRDSLLTRRTARLMNLPPVAVAERARTLDELGWRPRPTEVSIREAVQFFLARREARRAGVSPPSRRRS